MVLLNWLMDGLVFISGDFFLYQAAFILSILEVTDEAYSYEYLFDTR